MKFTKLLFAGVVIGLALAVSLIAGWIGPGELSAQPPMVSVPPSMVVHPSGHDISPPLRDIASIPPTEGPAG